MRIKPLKFKKTSVGYLANTNCINFIIKRSETNRRKFVLYSYNRDTPYRNWISDKVSYKEAVALANKMFSDIITEHCAAEPKYGPLSSVYDGRTIYGASYYTGHTQNGRPEIELISHTENSKKRMQEYIQKHKHEFIGLQLIELELQ